LAGAFWADRQTQAQQVVAWLRERPTVAQWEAAFFADAEDPATAERSVVVESAR
jgi:hypothetical protein